MKKISYVVCFLFYVLVGLAEEPKCLAKIHGFRLVKNTSFNFVANEKKSCFFAYYTNNPDPTVDVKGNGNKGQSIWYGYYHLSNPNKIYEFPKPLSADWSEVCSINAISFIDMDGDGTRDVTVIGSCDQNAINYTIPFVFLWRGNKYILDKDAYINLYGSIGLTVADVRQYIRSSSRTKGR